MEPTVIIGILGFLGVCVAAGVPAWIASQARQEAREAKNVAGETKQQIIGLGGTIDGNLTKMLKLAEAAAAAEARADEKQRGVDAAAALAATTAVELALARSQSAVGEKPADTTPPKTTDEPGG